MAGTDLYPVAGLKIYIGGTKATQVADFVAADFSAVTWSKIASLRSTSANPPPAFTRLAARRVQRNVSVLPLRAISTSDMSILMEVGQGN